MDVRKSKEISGNLKKHFRKSVLIKLVEALVCTKLVLEAHEMKRRVLSNQDGSAPHILIYTRKENTGYLKLCRYYYETPYIYIYI